MNSIVGEDNTVQTDGADVSAWKLQISGNNNRIEVAPGAIVRCHISMIGSGHRLVIGAGVILHDLANIVFEDSNCSTTIGDRSTVDAFSTIANLEGRTLRIGAECLFSSYITIRTFDSHSILDAPSGARINVGDDVQIGDRVWIGERAAVLKGVSIGNDSVVGMASMVVSDVPSGSVVAGNPARVVRSGVVWKHSRI